MPFTETDRSKWEPNTKELMKAAVDYVDIQRLALAPTAFETLQKQLGVTHKDCVLVRSRFWDTLDLPQKRYTDWFHDLVASGGVMQYIVNQVVYDLELKGITPEDINSFSCGVRGLPQRLKPSFFPDRYVRKRKAHIKAFGSEVITAIDGLCLLLQVLGCGGPQFDIITKARLVMSVLLSGDAAVGQWDRLEAYMYNLHCAFLVMYPQCATPKLHLMRHILDALARHRRNFHCAGGERMHRRTKTFGTFAYNKFHWTALKRSMWASLRDLQKADNYRHTRLGDAMKPLAITGVSVEAFKDVSYGMLKFRKGDACHYRVSGVLHIALVRGVIIYEGKPFVAAHQLRQIGGLEFDATLPLEVCIDCAVVDGCVPFLALDGKVTVLQPH